MIRNIFIFLILSVSTVVIAAQSGGDYTIKKSVVAAGGGTSTDVPGGSAIEGLIGQPIAGPKSTAGQYGVSGGFYSSVLIPSAASVSISGRVTSAGRGVRGAKVVAVDQLGNRRTVSTGGHGEYALADLEAGGTYLISVGSRRFSFISQIVTLADSLTGFDFIAQ